MNKSHNNARQNGSSFKNFAEAPSCDGKMDFQDREEERPVDTFRSGQESEWSLSSYYPLDICLLLTLKIVSDRKFSPRRPNLLGFMSCGFHKKLKFTLFFSFARGEFGRAFVLFAGPNDTWRPAISEFGRAFVLFAGPNDTWRPAIMCSKSGGKLLTNGELTRQRNGSIKLLNQELRYLIRIGFDENQEFRYQAVIRQTKDLYLKSSQFMERIKAYGLKYLSLPQLNAKEKEKERQCLTYPSDKARNEKLDKPNKKSKVRRRPTRSANQTKYPKELPTKSIQNHCTALIYIYNNRIKSISQFPKSEIEIAIPIQSLTKTSGKLKSDYHPSHIKK
ncbi:hypothetical protein YC2023_062186 [Brassica napus]